MAAATSPLPVRRPQLGYGAGTDVVWTPRRPEFSCAANSVSLLMPYMEPYFVRSVAASLARLDPELRARTRSYLGQEMQHQHQHRQFNRLLLARYSWLGPVERLAERTYRWLGTTRSTSFNVGVAAASETIAYAAARWSAERRRELFEGADPDVTRLFVWHLAEEVEHKSAAVDVYRAIDGRPWRYVPAMVVSIALVMFFVGLGTTVMLAAERRLWNPLSWLRLTKWAITFAFEAIPLMVISALPDAHPDQLADPLWYEVWLDELDAEDSLPAEQPGQSETALREADAESATFSRARKSELRGR